MKHHSEPSILATSSIKHMMSVTDYLISAHVSAQQHYRQQLQGAIKKPMPSPAKVTSSSTTGYENIHQEVFIKLYTLAC